jgi:D-sedoheptulose 7-phosphate isomerase
MSIEKVFADHAEVMARAAAELPATLQRIIGAVHACLKSGHKVFACGNGGSASDAQHLVAELIGRYLNDRRSVPAIALTADAATLTAIANDYGYERVFARQLEGLARPGDLLFAISTSGNSPNVVQAAQTARSLGCVVVGMTGERDSKVGALADPGLLIRAPSAITARIQEVHSLCIHVIAEAVDTLIQQSVAP